MATINDTNERNISTVNVTPYGIRSGSASQIRKKTSDTQKKAASTIREKIGTKAAEHQELSPSAIDNLNAVTSMALNPYRPENQQKRQELQREDAQQTAVAQDWLSTFEQTIAPYVKLTDAEKRYYDKMSRVYIEQGTDPAAFAEDFLTANAIANATGMSRKDIVTYADQLSDYFLGQPAQRNMTWGRNLINSWQQGTRQQEMFKLQDEYRDLFAEGYTDNDAIVQYKLKQIQDLQEEIDYNTDATPHNWLVNWISDGIAQVPYMLSGLGAGAIGAAVGAAAGSLIPVVGTKIGATVGNYLGRFISYRGSFSGNSFYEMKQAGISNETALKLSGTEGTINALNESLLDAVSDTLIGAIGGDVVKTVLYPNIFKKLAAKGSIHNFAGQVALYLAGQGTGEFIQEATQSLTTSAFVYAAEEMDNIPHSRTAMQALNEALEEGVAGFAVGLLFGLPGSVVATAQDVRASASLFDKAVNTPSREAFVNSQENLGAVKGMKLAGEHFTDNDAKLELGRMWDNAAEARLNRLNARVEVAGGSITTKEGKKYSKLQLTPERLDGRLRSETSVDYSDDAQKTAQLIIDFGGVTPVSAESTAPHYGTVRMSVDHNNRTAAINSVSINEGYESQAREMVRQAIQDNAPGYTVSWDTDVDLEKAVRDALIRDNPKGMEAGLTYEAAANTGREAEIAEYSSRIRNSFTNLSDREVNAAVHVLDILAKHHNMTISQLEEQYAGGDFFIHGDSSVAQRAQGQRGAYRPLSMQQIAQGVKGVIYAGENADTSTFFHEFFHFAADIDESGRRQLSRAVKRMANENAAMLRQFINDHGEIFADKDADHVMELFSNLDENSRWDTELNEAMTSLYEAWTATHDDANLTPEVKTILQKIADFMRQVYQTIKGNAKLDADVQAGFERIMGYDGSTVSSSIQQTGNTKGTLYQSESSATPESEFEQTEKKLRSITSNFDEQGRHLAPNGEPSNLPYRQWVMVRTPSFKRWFGDWEGAANLEWLMNSEPIAILTGEEFKENIIDNVAALYETYGNRVYREGLGYVTLTRHDIQSSVSHGLGRKKAAAFAAIPDVIREGREFNRTENYKDRGYDSIVIAAPISIAGETYVCEVVLNKRANSNNFYLHEVEVKNKLQFSNQVRNYMDENHPNRNTETRASRFIISKLFAEGKFNTSKVLDENGEPLIVYHGTASEFTVFNRAFLGSSTDANSSQIGFFFTDSHRTAEGYGEYASQSEVRQLYKRVRELERQGRWDEANQIEMQVEELALHGGSEGIVMPVFLNIRNPYEVDAYGADFKNVEGLFAGFEKGRHDGVIVYDLNDNIDGDYTANHYVALESNQIKSIDNTGSFDPDNPDILFQTGYHGTKANFNRFDLSYVNTGAGSQAFGIGVYVTESGKIAEEYAGLAYTQNKKDSDIKFYSDILSRQEAELKRFDEARADKSKMYKLVEAERKEILAQYEKNIKEDKAISPFMRMVYGDKATWEDVRDSRLSQLEEYPYGYRNTDRDKIINKITQTKKNLENVKALPVEEKHLYTVEIPDSGYLYWDRKVPAALTRRIAKALGSDEYELDDMLRYYRDSGQDMYIFLSKKFADEKQIADLLSSLGVVGISYPAGTNVNLPEGVSDKTRNFVIFNPEDVQIISNDILFQSDNRYSGFFTRSLAEAQTETERANTEINEEARQEFEDNATEDGMPFDIDESMSASNIRDSIKTESEIKPWDENSWWIDENGELITSEEEYNAYLTRYVRPLIKGRFANLFHHNAEQSIDEMIASMKPSIVLTAATDEGRDEQFLTALKDEETFRRIFGLLGEIYYLNTTTTNAQRVEVMKKINGKMRPSQETQIDPYIDQKDREKLQKKLQGVIDNPAVISVMKQAIKNEAFSSSSSSTKSRAMKAIAEDVRLYRNMIANILGMAELRPESLTDNNIAGLPSREAIDSMPLSQVKTLLTNNTIDAVLNAAQNNASTPDEYTQLANIALLLKTRLNEADITIERLKGKDNELSAALEERDSIFSSIERWLEALTSLLGLPNVSVSRQRKNEIKSILYNLNGEKRYQNEATDKGARERGKAIGAKRGTREWLKDMAAFYPSLKPETWTSSRDYETQLRKNIDTFRQQLMDEDKSITPANVSYLVGKIREFAMKQHDELKVIKGSLSKLLIEVNETVQLAKSSKIDSETETTQDGFTIGDTESGEIASNEAEDISADSSEPIDESLGISRLTGSEDSKDTQLIEAIQNDSVLRDVMKRYGAYQQNRIESQQAYADESASFASSWANGEISDEDMDNFREDVSQNPRLYRRRFSIAFGRSDMAARQQGGLPPIESAGASGGNISARGRRSITRQAKGIDTATAQSMTDGSETLDGNVEAQLKRIGKAIKEIKSQINADQKKIENRNSKISQLKSDIASKNRQIKSLNNRLEKGSTQDSETIDSLKQELTDLRNVVHNLEIQMRAEERHAETEKRNLEAKNARLKERQAEEKEYRKLRDYKLKLAKSIFRKWTRNVDFRTVAPLMKYIRESLDPAFRQDWAYDPIAEVVDGQKRPTVSIDELRELYAGIDAGEITDIDKEELKSRLGLRLYNRISGEGAKPLNDWAVTELEELKTRLDEVWDEGRLIQRAKDEAKRSRRRNLRNDILTSVKSTPKYNDEPELTGTGESIKRKHSLTTEMQGNYYATKRMQELAYYIDGSRGQRGTAYDLLVEQVRTMLDEEYRNEQRRMKPYEEAMNTYRQWLKDNGFKESAEEILFHKQYEVNLGDKTVHYNLSALAYIYLSQFNAKARDAVAYGSLVSPQEKGHISETGSDRRIADYGGANEHLLGDDEIKGIGDMRYKAALARAEAVLNETGAMSVVAAIRDDLWNNDNAQRIFNFSLDVFNQPVVLEDHYLFVHRLTAQNTRPETIKDLNMAAGQALESIEKGFLEEKKTIAPVNQMPANLDLFGGWIEAMQQQEHLLAGGRLLSDLRAVFETNKEVVDVIERRFGKGMVTEIHDYIAHVADPHYSDVRNDVSRVINFLRGSVSTAYLGFKLSSIFVQVPTSLAPFLGSVKSGSLLKSFIQMLAHPARTWRFITDRSVRMERRTPTIMIEDIQKEARKQGKGQIARTWARFNEVGMKGLEWVDKLTVGAGWLAKYYDVLDRCIAGGMDTESAETAAIKAADDLVYEVQPVSDKTEVARLFRSNNALLKMFLQFQQAMNVVYNNVTTDTHQQWKTRKTDSEVIRRIVGRLIGYAGAGMILGLIQQGFDDDDDDLDKLGKIAYWGVSQGVDSIPVIGSIASGITSAILTGQFDSYTMEENILPFASDLGSYGARLITALRSEDGPDMERALSAAEGIALSLGTAVGAPTSTIKQIIRSIEQESFMPMLGRY